MDQLWRERDVAAGVDGVGLAAALPHLQMQVVAGGIAGAAHIADELALLDVLAGTGATDRIWPYRVL